MVFGVIRVRVIRVFSVVFGFRVVGLNGESRNRFSVEGYV